MIDTVSIKQSQAPMIPWKLNGCRPRVLLFTDSFSRGDTERQFVRFVRSLDRSRYDLIIGCLHRRGHLLSEAESLGVPIVEFPINSLYNFQDTSLFAVPAARIAGVPVVLASRRELLNLRSPWQQRAVRIECRLATGVVVNSRAAGRDSVGLESGIRNVRRASIKCHF